MNSINFHFSFPSLHLHPNKHYQLLNTHKLLCPFSLTKKLGHTTIPIRTKAIITPTNPLILVADTSPEVTGGDVSVLLQTGSLLLFVYGIANFVVPAFISKSYEFDKKTEDSVPEEDSSLDDEERASAPKSKSLGKKRGFQGTKT